MRLSFQQLKACSVMGRLTTPDASMLWWELSVFACFSPLTTEYTTQNASLYITAERSPKHVEFGCFPVVQAAVGFHLFLSAMTINSEVCDPSVNIMFAFIFVRVVTQLMLQLTYYVHHHLIWWTFSTLIVYKTREDGDQRPSRSLGATRTSISLTNQFSSIIDFFFIIILLFTIQYVVL